MILTEWFSRISVQKTEPRYIEYCGFQVCYKKDDALIGRILRDGVYEPENIEQIIAHLPRSENAVMLDIGANIGLVSLACLRERDDLTIYAFEPGPHQCNLLRKTIQINKLEQHIKLEEIAFSRKKGVSVFYIHSPSDASGDGFIDTKRAGRTRKISVSTDTLDNWWEKAGHPDVTLVKMDTEGAEYWILEGGEKFLQAVRPVIFLEINPKNIKNYPFSIGDVVDKLETQNYCLCFIDGTPITKETIFDYFHKNDSFIAYPM